MILGLLLALPLGAQSPVTFKGRLAPLPVTATTVDTLVGSGSASAVLSGNVLTITGKFEGLGSPATGAHLHRAQPGVRGPSVQELTVTKAVSGTIEGRVTLTEAQLNGLQRGWYYVQVQTEQHPDGQLRGWLLK